LIHLVFYLLIIKAKKRKIYHRYVSFFFFPFVLSNY